MARQAIPNEQLDAVELLSVLVRAATAVRGCLAGQLEAGLGLLPEEADLLMLLEAVPEQRLRMADVSRSLGVSKSGVTRLVDRLERRGLVERAACPKDRRVTYAGLNDAGRAAVAEAAPVVAAAAEAHLGRHLTAVELSSVLGGLKKILTAQAVGG
jgi:DNA-binding MarR family transcriptional regulator